MKKSFYFSHDYNSRNDPKMVSLFKVYKLKGIGVFWCIVEMLYEEDGCLMLSQCERIAFELREKIEVIKSVISDFNLFKNDGEKFWSESVNRRLNKRNEKSVKATESANKRWWNANGMRTHSEGNAIKGNKRKLNKRKEINKENIVSEKFLSEDFKKTWLEWVNHRTEIKHSLKPASIKKQIFFLEKFPEETAIEILNQSIQNGWQGLFELKTQNNGSATHSSGSTKPGTSAARIEAIKKW